MGWKTTGGGQKSLMLKNRSRERHLLRTLMVKENVVSFKYFIFYCKILGIFAYVGGFYFYFFARLFVGSGPMSLYYEIAVFLYCQIIHITLRWKSVKPLQIAEISFETSSFHNPRIFVYLHNFKWARMKLLSSCCLIF